MNYKLSRIRNSQYHWFICFIFALTFVVLLTINMCSMPVIVIRVLFLLAKIAEHQNSVIKILVFYNSGIHDRHTNAGADIPGSVCKICVDFPHCPIHLVAFPVTAFTFILCAWKRYRHQTR